MFLKRNSYNWKLNSGVSIEVSDLADWVIYNDIFVDGEYDLALSSIANKARENKNLVVLDLGANKGFFLLKLLHDYILNNNIALISVYAFEAVEQIFLSLKFNIEKNRSLTSDKVNFHLFNNLIGKTSGFEHIKKSRFHLMSKIARESFFSKKVHYLDLNNLFASINKIDLIKCDIEGSEYDFILSSRDVLKKTEALIIEFHEIDKVHLGHFFDILFSLGFVNMINLKTQGTTSVLFFHR